MTKEWKKTLTLKGDGTYAHPWLVIKGDTTEDLQNQLSEAHEQDLFTAIGRAHAAMERGVMMGSKLDATTIKSEATPDATPAPTTPSTPTPSPFEEAAPKEEATPPPAVPSGAPTPAWKR